MSTDHDVEFAVMLSATIGDESYAHPESFDRVATACEDAGFDALWVGDHVVVPDDLHQEYPYHPEGKPPFDVSSHIHDAFGVLSYFAGTTDRIALGTNVCIVPYRRPLVLARMISTLESLSRGRFEFGAGAGWLRDEFAALGVPFEERGSRTDEFLELFTRAREEGQFAFDGPHHSFDSLSIYPTPEAGRPPVWVGGNSGAAFRRVAEYGDGWTAVWDRPEKIAAERERLLDAWADYDRDGDPGVAVMRPAQVGPEVESDRPLVGDAASVVADVEAYADAGTTRIVVDFTTRDIDEQVEQLRRWGEDVLPAFG